MWGNIAVHKDAVPNFTPKKKQPPTKKRRIQRRQNDFEGLEIANTRVETWCTLGEGVDIVRV